MSSKETKFGKDCQMIFGASEHLADIKQENKDSVEITIENNQNSLNRNRTNVLLRKYAYLQCKPLLQKSASLS